MAHRTNKPFLQALALLAALLGEPGAAAAQSTLPGCDIPTTSYVVIDPPTQKPRSAVTTALPQTPCATLPNGYEGTLGQVSIDIGTRDLADGQQSEGGAVPTPPRRDRHGLGRPAPAR